MIKSIATIQFPFRSCINHVFPDDVVIDEVKHSIVSDYMVAEDIVTTLGDDLRGELFLERLRDNEEDVLNYFTIYPETIWFDESDSDWYIDDDTFLAFNVNIEFDDEAFFRGYEYE